MKMQPIDGKEIKHGQTCCVDHVVQVVSVTIRSLNGVGRDTLKNLIETKYEVVDIKQVDRTTYSCPGLPDFPGD